MSVGITFMINNKAYVNCACKTWLLSEIQCILKIDLQPQICVFLWNLKGTVEFKLRSPTLQVGSFNHCTKVIQSRLYSRFYTHIYFNICDFSNLQCACFSSSNIFNY